LDGASRVSTSPPQFFQYFAAQSKKDPFRMIFAKLSFLSFRIFGIKWHQCSHFTSQQPHFTSGWKNVIFTPLHCFASYLFVFCIFSLIFT
jgi:hypothetical protein